MESDFRNDYGTYAKKSPKRKKTIIVVAAIVIVAVVLIIVFSSNPNKKVAGVYYEVYKSYGGGYTISTGRSFELKKDGTYIDKYGMIGSYKYKSGKVIITEKALGITAQTECSYEKGLIIIVYRGSESYYIKLDEPPVEGQKLDKLPTEE